MFNFQEFKSRACDRQLLWLSRTRFIIYFFSLSFIIILPAQNVLLCYVFLRTFFLSLPLSRMSILIAPEMVTILLLRNVCRHLVLWNSFVARYNHHRLGCRCRRPRHRIITLFVVKILFASLNFTFCTPEFARSWYVYCELPLTSIHISTFVQHTDTRREHWARLLLHCRPFSFVFSRFFFLSFFITRHSACCLVSGSPIFVTVCWCVRVSLILLKSYIFFCACLSVRCILSVNHFNPYHQFD